ncbi:metallophosphoesterase [Spirochaeta africana]|uniref:Calcineurin-like phosphoesterase n=1 Tax=Spirochaeta africana (strain ATCC 700263 / DSM 8902 / Z-7692) TaxID=889378 RepID=H9UI45_SPIAZ|nr:metallophosphoesterase [Spirochaeta africana]AFG37188.1 Calcineurin-like phosphoesterase [Spirochaeta africana DSM 8902]
MKTYDIIGDVHGHATALEGLLRTLGYEPQGSSLRHPDRYRQAIFVGDIVDRGPEIPRAVRLVRGMVESGAALMVLGNHEYNLIGYHTPIAGSSPQRFIRAHTAVHYRQCQETLQQFAAVPGELDDHMNWMRQLPLFLELPQLRVVHAAWHPQAVNTIQEYAPETHALTDALLQDSSRRGSAAARAIEQLLKGVEINLPQGLSYHDKEGVRRTRTRVAWWRTHQTDDRGDGCIPLSELVFPPDIIPPAELSRVRVPVSTAAHVPGYSGDTPVFMGHYWLTGEPRLVAPDICCLDFSIAAGGLLTSYTYRGEQQLSAENLLQVDAAGIPQ